MRPHPPKSATAGTGGDGSESGWGWVGMEMKSVETDGDGCNFSQYRRANFDFYRIETPETIPIIFVKVDCIRGSNQISASNWRKSEKWL